MNDTFERVRVLMMKEFGLESARVTPQTLLTELGVDSLATLEFVFTLQREFAIRFDADVDLSLREVGQVVTMVDAARSRVR